MLPHGSTRGVTVVVGRCSFLPVNNYIDEDLLKLLIELKHFVQGRLEKITVIVTVR